MDVRRRVGLNVRNFREARGLSQEAFALESNIHRTYISGVQRGIRNPTVVVLEKIAKTLGVPTARLLDEIEGRKRYSLDVSQALHVRAGSRFA